jgi:hypothetical protein
MLIEAPIIMLLAASTALARDRDAYRFLNRTMHRMGMTLTVLHVLLAVTPLYDLVVGTIMHTPQEVRGPARIGLLLMTPWTYSIAYRRLQQGVLIRAGRSHPWEWGPSPARGERRLEHRRRDRLAPGSSSAPRRSPPAFAGAAASPCACAGRCGTGSPAIRPSR